MSKFVKSLLKDSRFQCPHLMKISNADWEAKLEDMIENPETYQKSIMSEMLAKVTQENRDSFIAFSTNGTPVHSHPEAHPHRLDLAAEAISKMVIPAAPADPSDRNQTKIVAEYDFGHKIGVCHLVKIENHANTYRACRGNRPYKSHMVLQQPADETKLTSVVIWIEDKWILLTNYEGSALSIPEPDSEAYELGTEEEQDKWDEFWWNYGLVPTEQEIEDHIKQIQNEVNEEEQWLHSWYGCMLSLEYNSRATEIESRKRFIRKMKEFTKIM